MCSLKWVYIPRSFVKDGTSDKDELRTNKWVSVVHSKVSWKYFLAERTLSVKSLKIRSDQTGEEGGSFVYFDLLNLAKKKKKKNTPLEPQSSKEIFLKFIINIVHNNSDVHRIVGMPVS